MNQARSVAVIGGGLMGCGIAQVFAGHADFRVTICDAFVAGDAMLARIRGNLALLLDKGVMTAAEADALIARVTPAADLAAAVKDADFVVECIPENMQLKQDLFVQLESLVRPDAVLATNTSVMSITEIASRAQSRHRIVGTHFWNPPYLVPLVEVVRGDDTDEASMAYTLEILTAAGKHAIRVNRDVPGFVANRLQHALWREAISIVENGIADAKTVDEAVKMSFGLRLPVLAPLENSDLVGSDLTLSIHQYLLKHLESSPEASPLLRSMAEEGRFGFKSGQGFHEWTDASIAAKRRELNDHLIRMLYGK